MVRNFFNSLTAINLLYTAGFLVILVFGFLGTPHLILGLALYLAGVFLMFRVRSYEAMHSLGVTTIGLFLVNLVFFSSRELTQFLDLSLGLYLLLLGNLILLNVRQRKIRKKPFVWPYWKPVLFFLLSIAVSIVMAEHVKDALYFLAINVGAVVLFYASINLLDEDRASLIAIVKWMAGLGIVSSAFAVWQLYSESFKFVFYPYIAVRDQEILELWEFVSRVVGTWQHPSYLGIYLALALPLSVYILFYASKSRLEEAFWTAGIIFMGAGLLLTNTRSSVLSGFLGVVLLYIFGNLAQLGFLKRLPNIKKFAALGLLAVASLLLYQFVFVAEIYTKPQAARVDASATIWGRFLRADSMSTESLVQRSELYTLAADTFFANPLTGIGGKNFTYLVEDIFERGTDAHNLALQTAAETGLVGIVASAILYVTLFWHLFQRVRSAKSLSQKYLGAGLLAVTLLVLFDSMFNNPLYGLRILAVFWLIIALQHINTQSSA